jgi:phage shock protein C
MSMLPSTPTPVNSRTRLMRSRRDRVVAGVCAGIGDYLEIDIALVRVFFAVLLFGGVGLPLYIVLWIAMPEMPLDDAAAPSVAASDAGSRRRFALYAGIGLIGWGVLLLLRELGVPGMRWITGDLMIPIALLLVGFALLVRGVRSVAS